MAPSRCPTFSYEGESNENLKSVTKIRSTTLLFLCFNNDTHGLKSARHVAVRYYIDK